MTPAPAHVAPQKLIIQSIIQTRRQAVWLPCIVLAMLPSQEQCRIGPGKTTRVKCRHATYLTHGENPPCPATHTTRPREKTLEGLELRCNVACFLRATPHRSAPAHTHMPHRNACHSAPRAQGRCALHRARGGGAHRAGPCAAASAGAGRLQGGAAKLRRARCAIFPRRCRARRRPALQPRAGTYTWHRVRQSRWSSARAARGSALRCATPPRPKQSQYPKCLWDVSKPVRV
jgi:hypothetical protein